jgi:hypothetical protein
MRRRLAVPDARRQRSRAEKQRDYRRRFDAGAIKPPTPISKRVREALIRRAVTFGGLSRKDAEIASENPDWIAAEASEALEVLADEWVEK